MDESSKTNRVADIKRHQKRRRKLQTPKADDFLSKHVHVICIFLALGMCSALVMDFVWRVNKEYPETEQEAETTYYSSNSEQYDDTEQDVQYQPMRRLRNSDFIYSDETVSCNLSKVTGLELPAKHWYTINVLDNTLHTELKMNNRTSRLLARQLSRCGGEEAHEVVRNMLVSLMEENVYHEMTYQNLNEYREKHDHKIVFSYLYIHQVFLDAFKYFDNFCTNELHFWLAVLLGRGYELPPKPDCVPNPVYHQFNYQKIYSKQGVDRDNRAMNMQQPIR